MADFWAMAEGERLVFGYRARRWDSSPPPFLNSSELTGVMASAYDETGSAIPVAQQPSYVAALQGYVGWMLASDLVGKRFTSLVLVPTLAGGLPASWAPTKTVDVRIDQAIAAVVAVLEETAEPDIEGGGSFAPRP